MDCNRARQLADFARPGVVELDAAELAALERHFADCPECGHPLRAQRRDDARIARAMLAVPVPADLGLRVQARLLATRSAWWRFRIVGAAAVTSACVLLATVLIVTFARPTLDPNAIAMATYEQSGQGRSPDEAQAVATNWLRGIDKRLSAPAEWNYKLLAFVSQSDFAGLSSVPTLVLSRGDATARIYAVRESALKNLAALDQPIEEGGCSVALQRYSDAPGWVFIVVTSGGPIDLFLRAVAPTNPA